MKSFKSFVTEALGKKSSNGKVQNYQEPGQGKGDHVIHHDGDTYHYTGKSGTHMKTGEASHEYRTHDEKGIWVRKSGHVDND